MTTILLAIALLLPAHAFQTRTGRVSGRIVNANGMPASGVRVAAMPVPREGETSVPTLTSLASTDASGRYTLEAVEPGTYYITAGRVDQPVYFPGVFQQSGAKAITVAAGAAISDIDFKTAEAPTYTISGRVVLQPGQQVPANSTIGLTGTLNQTAAIKPDGTFEFGRLRPGTYGIRFAPSMFSPVRFLEIVDANLTGIELPIPVVFPVTGTATVDDGKGTPGRISLSFAAVGKQTALAEVSAQRSFSIDLPEGEYRVSPGRTLNGFEVKSLTAGSIDLFKDTLKVAHTGTPLHISMTLGTPPPVRFEGRADRQLRRIILQKAGSEDVEGATQTDGSFVFAGIAPGTYTAVMTTALGATSVQTDVVVPPGGKSDYEIRISEVRRLSVRMTIEGNLADPLVRLAFTGPSGVTSITVDGSQRDTPVGVSLPNGEYKVSVTLRQKTGQDAVRVKALTSGAADLLTAPLNIAENSPAEILLTLGK